VAVEVEIAMLLHSHLWLQFDPVHKGHHITTSANRFITTVCMCF